jgi:hypothetical protein
MSRLRILKLGLAAVIMGAGLGVAPAFAASTQTLTGKISDSMCGAQHKEKGISPADCVRACVKHGAQYTLVVGDKVYTLDTSDPSTLSKLNTMAWEEANVTGTVNGDTITVKSVSAAK